MYNTRYDKFVKYEKRKKKKRIVLNDVPKRKAFLSYRIDDIADLFDDGENKIEI